MTAARAEVLTQAQEAVHKFNYAIAGIRSGNLLAVDVAEEMARVAEQLLDQALGQPTVGQEARWQQNVEARQSDDPKVRASADKQNAAWMSQIAALSEGLDTQRQRAEKAEAAAAKYAAEKERIANLFLKFCWVAGALVGIYMLGQVLAFAAHFNPAFSAASAAVNSVVSPAMHSLLHRAHSLIDSQKSQGG